MAIERNSTILGDIFLQKNATHSGRDAAGKIQMAHNQMFVDDFAVVPDRSKSPDASSEWLPSEGTAVLDSPSVKPVFPNRKSNHEHSQQGFHELIPPCAGPARVLVADDNLLVRMCLMNLLEQWGMTYYICDNGLEAWKSLQESEFDLLLIDLQMPGMDGHEVVQRLRADKLGKNTNLPVVALAGTDSADAKARMFEAGTNAFLTKPFCPDNLNRTLVKYLQILPAQRTQLFSDIIDQHQLFDLYEDDYDHMYQMFSIFLKNTPTALNNMDKAMQQKDLTSLKREVHKVKPTFAMVGLRKIGQMAEQLDDQLQQVSQLSAELRSNMKRFRQSVQQGLEVVVKEQESIANYLK